MPNGDWYAGDDDAAQYGSGSATGPEPAAAHRAYVANHGEVYRPGLRVRVRVPRDEHTGEIGTVQSNYNDGGEMAHVLRFEDGTKGQYGFHDLIAL